MKSRYLKTVTFMLLMAAVSCDEPITLVTNIIHSDGSVTRRLEMRNDKNIFKQSDMQVPFDSTWNVRDSVEVNEEGDTAWVKRAWKYYEDVEEINISYQQDSGANKDVSRHADFRKRFKWFNTEFRFSEMIDERISNGYPLKDFLNDEELNYFYYPDRVRDEKRNGEDSTKYKSMEKSIEEKKEIWTTRNFVMGWIRAFAEITKGKPDSQEALDSLWSHEDRIAELIIEDEDLFDSLWTDGEILRESIGEGNYRKFLADADAAEVMLMDNFLLEFLEYSVKFSMPGEVLSTNGFMDSAGLLLWQVKSDYFMTEPYEMWAVSKVSNRWAWIISALFLVFVLTGLFIRINKRG